MNIQIVFEDKKIDAVLNSNSLIVKELLEKMPIMARATTTEGIVYFPVPIVAELEKTTQVVNIGDIAYWKECGCVDIFVGKTKHSNSDKPKSIDPVTIIGKVTGDITVLQSVKHRDKIELVLP